ncbi:MAG: hypothetical protein RQ833_07480 [Sphingomonadaceae bacterium]|nr:hypothetical protein [Sphingomonadaceae bacterium]
MSALAALMDVPLFLPYQQRAVELSHQHKLLVIEKSRRTGITYALAADDVLSASAAEGAEDVYYTSYNLEMTREYIDYCASFARAFNIAATQGEFFWKVDGSDAFKVYRIDFPSGKSIVALPGVARALRGKQGKVRIDEGAFVDNLPELIKAALALGMWGRGGTVVVSTHDGADNPFNILIEDIRAGKTEGCVMRVTLADALADGLYKRICLVSGTAWTPEGEAEWERSLRARYGPAAEEELDVIPARGSGVYLSRAVIEDAMVADAHVVRLRAPDELVHWPADRAEAWIAEWWQENVRPLLADFPTSERSFAGGDWARTGDVSALLLGQTEPDLTRRARVIVEMRNVPFREQLWVAKRSLHALPRFCGAKFDARGLGMQISEELLREFGAARIECVQTTQNTYLAGMPLLKAGLEDRTFLLPRDEGVLDDHRLVKLVRGVPMIVDRTTDKADGAKGKRHGDTAIASMLFLMAVRDASEPFDFTPANALRAPRLAGADPDSIFAGFGVGGDGFGLSGGSF